MINVLKIEFANYFGIKLFHKIYLLKKKVMYICFMLRMEQ